MFVANSLEYALRGFDETEKMWIFDRLPNDSGTRQVVSINKAKFIDKVTDKVYFLDEEGTKSLTYSSRRLARD